MLLLVLCSFLLSSNGILFAEKNEGGGKYPPRLLSKWALCVSVPVFEVASICFSSQPPRDPASWFLESWSSISSLAACLVKSTFLLPSPVFLLFVNEAMQSYCAIAESYANSAFSSQNSRRQCLAIIMPSAMEVSDNSISR